LLKIEMITESCRKIASSNIALQLAEMIGVYDSDGNVIETHVLLKNQGLFQIDGLSAR